MTRASPPPIGIGPLTDDEVHEAGAILEAARGRLGGAVGAENVDASDRAAVAEFFGSQSTAQVGRSTGAAIAFLIHNGFVTVVEVDREAR